jgi:hypothetical protein
LDNHGDNSEKSLYFERKLLIYKEEQRIAHFLGTPGEAALFQTARSTRAAATPKRLLF